jgi:hypothetical protein
MPPPPIILRLTAPAATRTIWERAADTGRIILTDHAQERMDERGITFPEVLRILRGGTVHEPPLRQPEGDWKARWKCGCRVDGMP